MKHRSFEALGAILASGSAPPRRGLAVRVGFKGLADAAPAGGAVKLTPTPGLKNSEGYPIVARVRFQGLPTINVEQRRGQVRSGDGWRVKMPYHYGEFEGTVGADGDPVDVCVGPDAFAPWAYVVHQKEPGRTGPDAYDEDKVMVGFTTRAAALDAYREAYDRPGFLGQVTRMSIGELQAWLERPGSKGKKIEARPGPPEASKAIDPGALARDAQEHPGRACEHCDSDPCTCEAQGDGAPEASKAIETTYRIPEHLRWVTA